MLMICEGRLTCWLKVDVSGRKSVQRYRVMACLLFRARKLQLWLRQTKQPNRGVKLRPPNFHKASLTFAISVKLDQAFSFIITASRAINYFVHEVIRLFSSPRPRRESRPISITLPNPRDTTRSERYTFALVDK